MHETCSPYIYCLLTYDEAINPRWAWPEMFVGFCELRKMEKYKLEKVHL